MIEWTVLGILLAGLLSALAYRTGALSKSGALAAAGIGTIVLGVGGWSPALLLVFFFISSSLFTRLSRVLKPERQTLFAKSGRRDASQVLANGTLPAIFALLLVFASGVDWMVAIVGALASATADTWATEWGVLAKREPRRITDWEFVPAGTSGGITPLGTLASLLGSLMIGVVAGLLQGEARYILVAMFSGLLGAALDSVLGATIQAQYRCTVCGVHTEQHPLHSQCGTETRYHSGLRWVNNDVVNLTANTFGALLALIWTI
jgi:uncharacterized protein (TIGR00297 family)